MSDPVTEWSDALGLEEPLWKLGLGEDENENENEVYPERPNEADCIYYLRNGVCGYGSRCRFNHPRDRAGSLVGATRGSDGEYPERIGQPLCQYYMRTGLCKFGSSCKYHHPRQGTGSSTPVALNVSGYPLRPGEKECTYYVKTGQCKFGVTCKFHHPQPTSMVPVPSPAPLSPMPSAVYQNVQSSVISSQPYGLLSGNWPVARPPVLPGSYLPGTYGPMLVPPGMVPFPGWNPYQAPIHPAVSPNPNPILGGSSVYAMTQFSASVPSYSLTNSQNENVYPQRPGEPECQHYVKTGDCKFGSSCRYHHPLDVIVPNANFGLSPMGLPLRPGSPLCIHYAQNGVCKFGPSCKFNHPMGTLSYSPSTSSLSDMPVAPSSELRPEYNTVGSSFSKSVQVSH